MGRRSASCSASRTFSRTSRLERHLPHPALRAIEIAEADPGDAGPVFAARTVRPCGVVDKLERFQFGALGLVGGAFELDALLILPADDDRNAGIAAQILALARVAHGIEVDLQTWRHCDAD